VSGRRTRARTAWPPGPRSARPRRTAPLPRLTGTGRGFRRRLRSPPREGIADQPVRVGGLGKADDQFAADVERGHPRRAGVLDPGELLQPGECAGVLLDVADDDGDVRPLLASWSRKVLALAQFGQPSRTKTSTTTLAGPGATAAGAGAVPAVLWAPRHPAARTRTRTQGAATAATTTNSDPTSSDLRMHEHNTSGVAFSMGPGSAG